jgi:hypothetical protein
VTEKNFNFFQFVIYKGSAFSTGQISIIVYVLIAVLSLDTIINQLSAILGSNILPSTAGIILFIATGVVTIACQLFILQFVGRTSLAIRSKVKHIKRMHTAVTISQYFIIFLFLFAMLEIVLTDRYSSISSLLLTTASYLVSITLMGIFTFLFLSWYRINRSSVLVLLYGLSFATVVISSVAILVLWMHLYGEQIPSTVFPTSDVIFAKSKEGTNWKILSLIYQYSDIASFFLKWGGTALILYHYSHKLGKVKYWFLLSLPVAYFSTLIIYHFHIYEPHEELETLIFIGITSLNSTFGGILFYLAFKITSGNFTSNPVLKDYLLMAGFGFMLFFSSTQANIITTVYPQFGFATVSSYGLGSYLILLGIYLSALSVSQDEQLRTMIRKSTLSESKFLHSIGTSAGEREKVIASTVLDKAKQKQNSIAKDIGIGTSLSEEDIKNYVKEVEKVQEEVQD